MTDIPRNKAVITLCYIAPVGDGKYCFEHFSTRRMMRKRRNVLLKTSVYGLKLFCVEEEYFVSFKSLEENILATINSTKGD